ncbi:Rv2578c family radical SAM protein [Microlunatus speluncae]|uniref:Rv2578c family radical SAM protein n=1 Tax=Microlunatus speluncae TaxID=2594267 RepID=UPI001266321E|nr:Rv2578c family radical SAM protein [Microlunatus speluncae]
MRWEGRRVDAVDDSALPGLGQFSGLVRSVRTPEFAGITFHEVMAKSALNQVSAQSAIMPGAWTINPYRGCQHGCVYCFARPTHSYLDLDTGTDFDTQIVVKINIVDRLRQELRRKGDRVEGVNLGTNTDPYQRAEGRYRLMPGIIGALADHGKPVSILTKGTLLQRDLPLLADVADRTPVSLAVSIAVYGDDELRASAEPHTATTKARLGLVRAIRDHGFDCTVLLMPVLPYLTDDHDHLDAALGQLSEAGATNVHVGALHLKPGVREWYLGWLARTHPGLVPRYRTLYGRGSYAPKSYREELATTVAPLRRRHGFDRSARSRLIVPAEPEPPVHQSPLF